jgi:uncharacterized protein involved in type VI secretion and phage assembly
MELMDQTPPGDGDGPRYFGVYPAQVTSIVKDERKLGRIELKFPFLGKAGEKVRALATLCTPYADQDQGFEFVPEVGSQVLVAFEAGNLRRPYVLGACWNGKAALPQTIEEANNKRVIRTRAKSVLEFDDTKGKPKITIRTQGGWMLELDEGGQTVTLQKGPATFIKLESSGGITITASGVVTINASSVTVNAPSSTFTGNVTCQALTATSVTAPVKSPAAGNML